MSNMYVSYHLFADEKKDNNHCYCYILSQPLLLTFYLAVKNPMQKTDNGDVRSAIPHSVFTQLIFTDLVCRAKAGSSPYH